MITEYTNSKGETMLIKDMANPHLIHSIAKLAANIEAGSTQIPLEEAAELLNALKTEAITRLAPKEE